MCEEDKKKTVRGNIFDKGYFVAILQNTQPCVHALRSEKLKINLTEYKRSSFPSGTHWEKWHFANLCHILCTASKGKCNNFMK